MEEDDEADDDDDDEAEAEAEAEADADAEASFINLMNLLIDSLIVFFVFFVLLTFILPRR